jgi:hypothetical protein
MGACQSKKALQHNDRVGDSYVMIKEPKKQKINHFPRLRDEVIQLIFKNLDANSLAKTQSICTRFKPLAQDNQVWVPLAKKFKIEDIASPDLRERVAFQVATERYEDLRKRMAKVGVFF